MKISKIKDEKLSSLKGFTPFRNECLTCTGIKPELKLLKIVLERHFGQSNECCVMQKTLAKEIGRTERTVRRGLEILKARTNLDWRRSPKINRYFLSPDIDVRYQKMRMSPIRCHRCPMYRKESSKRNILKKRGRKTEGKFLRCSVCRGERYVRNPPKRNAAYICNSCLEGDRERNEIY